MSARVLALLIALGAASLGARCGQEPASAPPATRQIDVWRDGVKLYYPQPGRSLVEVQGIDEIPDAWRSLLVFEFSEQGAQAPIYYIADVTGIYSGEVQAELISRAAINTRAARVQDALDQAAEAEAAHDAPDTSARAEAAPRSAKPSKRAAPTSAQAPEASPGIIIEGISRLPEQPQQPAARLPAADAKRFALSPAERAKEQRAALAEVNAARERGEDCRKSRRAQRSAPLVEQSMLMRVAQDLANDMARTGRTHRTDEQVRPLARAAGYLGQTYVITTEGVSTGREFTSKYVESAGWCQLLMEPSLKAVGFGVARSQSGFYWVLIVGDRS